MRRAEDRGAEGGRQRTEDRGERTEDRKRLMHSAERERPNGQLFVDWFIS